MANKIIRTICLFTENPDSQGLNRLKDLQAKFEGSGYVVQTVRIATSNHDFNTIRSQLDDEDIRISIGSLTTQEAFSILNDYHKSKNINFNIELSNTEITEKEVTVLLEIIENSPANTFNFTYLFNGVPTPFFPSAIYKENGFAVGLQSTDLSQDKSTLTEWLEDMHSTWLEIIELMQGEDDFLGIDSSVAPLFEGSSSLINLIKKFGLSFSESTLTNTYTTISNYIKLNNPKPYGLNGLMLPCLEDFELAGEYEKGEFSIERNIFLSLHSGLGIDTYPIGVDEDPTNILRILKLLKDLSNKYSKPLSVRFVSDGKAKIRDRTDFKNQYLKDVVIRKL